MKKLLSIILCLTLFPASALASGEASGGSSEETPMEALVLVDENGTTVAEEGYTYDMPSGEIREDGMFGVVMDTDDYTMNVVAVTGGRYTLDHCMISKSVSAVPEARGGVLAHVTDGLLFIRDSVLTTAGKGGIMYDDYPVECSKTGTMVIVDSEITQTGFGVQVVSPPKARIIFAVSDAETGSQSACAPTEKICTCQEIPVL